jgi:hypothetical protein
MLRMKLRGKTQVETHAAADPWTRLAAGILLQAFRDVKKRTKPEEYLDASLFLTGQDVSLYLDALGVEIDPARWEEVISGHL